MAVALVVQQNVQAAAHSISGPAYLLPILLHNMGNSHINFIWQQTAAYQINETCAYFIVPCSSLQSAAHMQQRI